MKRYYSNGIFKLATSSSGIIILSLINRVILLLWCTVLCVYVYINWLVVTTNGYLLTGNGVENYCPWKKSSPCQLKFKGDMNIMRTKRESIPSYQWKITETLPLTLYLCYQTFHRFLCIVLYLIRKSVR